CDGPVGACRLVFFFQAEDGIRDATVTGVQTCALPISSLLSVKSCCTSTFHGSRCSLRASEARSSFDESASASDGANKTAKRTNRSEERRVGKEGSKRRASNTTSTKTQEKKVQHKQTPQ